MLDINYRRDYAIFTIFELIIYCSQKLFRLEKVAMLLEKYNLMSSLFIILEKTHCKA